MIVTLKAWCVIVGLWLAGLGGYRPDDHCCHIPPVYPEPVGERRPRHRHHHTLCGREWWCRNWACRAPLETHCQTDSCKAVA